MKESFATVVSKPFSPLMTFSTIALVGKHKKILDVFEARSEGVEHAVAPLLVKYLSLIHI